MSNAIFIDATDIVEGNLNVILNLIWQLILNYQLQVELPIGDYEKEGKTKESGMTPKQILLTWVKKVMPPQISVNNFTTDWNDGRAVVALVYSEKNKLWFDELPEHLDPSDALENTKKAMDDAEEYLRIPRVSFCYCIEKYTAVLFSLKSGIECNGMGCDGIK